MLRLHAKPLIHTMDFRPQSQTGPAPAFELDRCSHYLSGAQGAKVKSGQVLSGSNPEYNCKASLFLFCSCSHPFSSFQIESATIKTLALLSSESHTSKVLLLKSSQSGTFTAFNHVSIRIVQGLRGKAAPLKAIVAILLRCLIVEGDQNVRVAQSSASTYHG